MSHEKCLRVWSVMPTLLHLPDFLKSSNHSGKSPNKSPCHGTVSFFLTFDVCLYFDVMLLLDLTKSLQLSPAVTM